MSASILGRGSTEQPLVVDTVPWGPDTTAEVVLSAVSILATLLVSFFIWWYDWRSERRQEKHDRELRLQEHAKLLSNTDAMHKFDDLKTQCTELLADLPADQRPSCSHAAVFRHGMQLSRHGICVTKETLSSVDAARKELQGIWDNIYGDFRRQRLPGAITDSSNGRIFKRAMTYMAAAEPLEAANYARMQDRRQVVLNRPYLIPRAQNRQEYPLLALGVRPGRFMWLENQQAMLLTKKVGSLWKDIKPPAAGQQPNILTFAELDADVWKELGSQGQKGFLKHWTAVEAAYQQLPLQLAAAGSSSSSGSVGNSAGSSGAGAAGPSSDVAQLVARQNVLLEQLLGLMQHQWPEAAAAAAAAGTAAAAAAFGSSNIGVGPAQPP